MRVTGLLTVHSAARALYRVLLTSLSSLYCPGTHNRAQLFMSFLCRCWGVCYMIWTSSTELEASLTCGVKGRAAILRKVSILFSPLQTSQPPEQRGPQSELAQKEVLKLTNHTERSRCRVGSGRKLILFFPFLRGTPTLKFTLHSFIMKTQQNLEGTECSWIN